MTQKILGAGSRFIVSQVPALLESAYQECPCHELAIRHLSFERQKPIPLFYKQAKLDCGYRLDVLVEGKIVVRFKSTDGLGLIHEAITLTYL
jgi:GxxExxY protein